MEKKILKAGAGKAVINYPAEFFPQENFGGIHDEIHGRALLLEQKEKVLILSLELPSIRPNRLVEEVRKEIGEYWGLKINRIWLCVTHNLSAPHVPTQEINQDKYEIHMNAIKSAINEAVKQAQKSLKPARVEVCMGSADINVNRDIETADGWWQGINPDGDSDKSVIAVKFIDENDKCIGAFFHYAVKSTTLAGALMKNGFRYVTADVTGEACRYAENRWKAPVLFFMGAAADQEPIKRADYFEVDNNGKPKYVNLGEKGFEFVKELGEILGREVAGIMEKGKEINISEVKCVHLSWMLQGQKFWTEGKPYHPVKEYEFIPSEMEELSVEVLILGPVVLFGMKPESTAIIGKKLREENPEYIPLMIAMVNGGKDYLSDKSAYHRLTFGGTHSVFAEGGAELFLEKAHEFLEELKKS